MMNLTVKDLKIKAKEALERIRITKNISEEINSTMVTENITCEVKEYSNFVVCYRLDEQGKRMQYLEGDLKIKIHKAIYDRLVSEGVIIKEEKEVEFKPEPTAIDTNTKNDTKKRMDVKMQKLTVISNGIKKREEKIVNSIKEFVSTGEYQKIRPYNIVEVNFELSEIGEHIDSAMENIKNELVKYYKRNGAKNIVVKSCWSTSDKVYNGLRNKEYFAGWIEIEFEKEIKNLGRVANNLDKKIEDIVYIENRKLEEREKMVNVEDMIIEHIEEAEKNKKVVKFKPELTAIDTRNSKSAEMVVDVATEEIKVLDYGCGTGRNIKYIKNNTLAIVHGCDIPEQLEKEKEKHSKLMDERTVIAPATELENEAYDVVLNSHVLNVIESDEVKKIVVADIFQKLKEGGKAVIEVRTKSDVEGAKTKEKYGDGWKIRKGSSFTYQEGITKEKMVNLLSTVGFKIEEHIYNSSRHIVVASK